MTLAEKALADLSDDARAAIAAVNAAVEALPPTSELSMSVMPEGTGGANFGEERLPTNPGSKVFCWTRLTMPTPIHGHLYCRPRRIPTATAP